MRPLRQGLVLTIAVGMLLALASAPAYADLEFVMKWGSPGVANGQFKSPQDVATDEMGNVYVVDRSNARVQKFDSAGNFVAKWGSGGTGPGQLFDPFGLAVAGGVVYVADSGNNRVQMFDTAGNLLGGFGGAGSGPGQFSFPTDVAADGAGNVYVSDTNNFRVQRFTADGRFVAAWGSPGAEHGQFAAPWGLATDAAGNLYVADKALARVELFSSSGAYLATFGGVETLVSNFGVAVDGAGNVFVADTLGSRLQQFLPSGGFAGTVASIGSGDGEVVVPFGMEFDAASGRLYVADTGNNRVQAFTVTVRDPAALLRELIEAVLGYGLSPKGVERSLVGKLEAALAAVSRGSVDAACGDLASFQHHVSAQLAKKLSLAQAEELGSAAAQIRETLGC
jgi:DNA-binding beta-propeller fold protein YncE